MEGSDRVLRSRDEPSPVVPPWVALSEEGRWLEAAKLAALDLAAPSGAALVFASIALADEMATFRAHGYGGVVPPGSA